MVTELIAFSREQYESIYPIRKKGKDNIIMICNEIFFFVINYQVKENFFTII